MEVDLAVEAMVEVLTTSTSLQQLTAAGYWAGEVGDRPSGQVLVVPRASIRSATAESSPWERASCFTSERFFNLLDEYPESARAETMGVKPAEAGTLVVGVVVYELVEVEYTVVIAVTVVVSVSVEVEVVVKVSVSWLRGQRNLVRTLR